MNNINRWDPFRDFLTLRHLVDELMDSNFERRFRGTLSETLMHAMPLDVLENEDAFVVKASLPGVRPDDLEIAYEKGILTIRGEVKAEETPEQSRYYLRERPYGRFSRSLSLPMDVDADRIEAQYERGELILTLPKTEDVKPKRIPIRAAGQPHLIEGEFQKEARKN